MCHLSVCVTDLLGNTLSLKRIFSVVLYIMHQLSRLWLHCKGLKVTPKVKFCIMLILIAVTVITETRMILIIITIALPALPELSYGILFSI
jgi:hypothetical protein